MKKQKTQNKGITLIALVITIIVMLILVAVTISMAVNGGLFEYAQYAGTRTNEATEAEQELANLEANMTVDELIDKYTVGTGTGDGEQTITGNNGEIFSSIYETNTPITQNGYTAIIPAGFAVGTSEGINTINDGLVIRDAQGNEFVWIPVTKTLQNSYSYAEGYTEPAEVAADAGKGYNFTSEYQAMVTSVNNNDGFYIGRYKTTIDANSKIGSKYNTPTLRSRNWYTLYEGQKTANVPGNGTFVQTAMIYGVLWDEAYMFVSQNNVENGESSVLSSIKDQMHTYGAEEWTQESAASVDRVCRGKAYTDYDCMVRVPLTHELGKGYYNPEETIYAYLSLPSRLIMYVL